MNTEEILELRLCLHRIARRFGFHQTTTPCGFALSVSQVMALQELEKGELSVTVLAAQLGLERSSVSRLVDSLVKGGFVHRQDNENNRREILLSLTDKGRETLKNVCQQSVAYFREVLREWDEDEQRQLVRSLQRFVHSLDAMQMQEATHE